MAVEPEAVMLPGTQLTAAADGAVDAADDADAAADGAVVAGAALAAVEAAADGAVLAPLLVQAVAAMLASRTSAPRRFGVEMLTWCSSICRATGVARGRFGAVPSV